MKKTLKKLLLLLLCVCMAQGAAFYTVPQEVQAAVKNGLKRENGSYYYYVDGVMVTNTWKTIKKTVSGKTVSYKYYFGKDGKAYAAPNLKKSDGYTKNVVVKKIGKYYYGFDRYGHMVKSGYYNDPEKLDKNGDSYTYYFDKKGRCKTAKSKAIRKATKYGVNAAKMRKLLGTPLKTKKINDCFGAGGVAYKLVYANLYVTIYRYPSGKEIVFGVFPR